jgi:hypothetical protein
VGPAAPLRPSLQCADVAHTPQNKKNSVLYNLTQLISRARVLIPGNLSVLSSDTIIL